MVLAANHGGSRTRSVCARTGSSPGLLAVSQEPHSFALATICCAPQAVTAIAPGVWLNTLLPQHGMTRASLVCARLCVRLSKAEEHTEYLRVQSDQHWQERACQVCSCRRSCDANARQSISRGYRRVDRRLGENNGRAVAQVTASAAEQSRGESRVDRGDQALMDAWLRVRCSYALFRLPIAEAAQKQMRVFSMACRVPGAVN